MNRKAFTLIEIIVVITILGLLIVLTIPMFGNMDEKQKEKALTVKIVSIETAAASWAIDHQSDPTWIFNTTCKTSESDGTSTTSCDKITIKVQKLIDDKYYSTEDNGKVTNPVTKADMRNDDVIIEKKYGQFYGNYQKK